MLKIKRLSGYSKGKTSLIFSVIIAIVCASFAVYSLDFGEYFFNKILYSYTVNQNLDYNVKIFDNNFFESKTVRSGDTYISKLVDDINIDFKYQYISKDTTPLTLLYSVTATNYILDRSNKDSADSVIKESKHILKNQEVKNASDPTNASFEDTIVINYDEYDKEIESFKENIFKSSYSKLVVQMDVKAIKNIDETEIPITYTSKVTIPLDEDSFTIDKDYVSNETKDVKKFENPKVNINYWMLISSLSALFLTLIWMFFIIKRRKNFLLSKREREVQQIFAKYDENIVRTLNLPENIYKDTIIVPEIKDIINLAEVSREPILYYEYKENEKTLSAFCISHDNSLYKFIVND